MIKEHCSAGISRLAFGIWLVSSLLVTAHAVAIRADVFVVLGVIQLVSTFIILIFGTRYQGSYCAVHRPRYPEANWAEAAASAGTATACPGVRRFEPSGSWSLPKPPVGSPANSAPTWREPGTVCLSGCTLARMTSRQRRNFRLSMPHWWHSVRTLTMTVPAGSDAAVSPASTARERGGGPDLPVATHARGHYRPGR